MISRNKMNYEICEPPMAVYIQEYTPLKEDT